MRWAWIGAALMTASGLVHGQEPTAPPAPAPTLVDNGTPTAGPTPSNVSRPASARPAGASTRQPRALPSTPSPITDHLALSMMYFLGRASTTGRFDSGTFNGGTGTGPEGTPFSAEHDLGVSSQAYLPLVELLFRLEQRNRLRLDFIDLRRSGEAVIGEPLQYGDQLFNKGQLVQSELDWRETDFTYTYSFLRTDRVELGVGAGLHLVQAYANAQVPLTAERAVYSAAGPFATVALDGTWRMTRHWSFNARGQYLQLAINESSGLLGDYHADLQYRIGSSFALGAGYEYRRIEVNIRNSDPSGFVQLNINGPEVIARLSL